MPECQRTRENVLSPYIDEPNGGNVTPKLKKSDFGRFWGEISGLTSFHSASYRKKPVSFGRIGPAMKLNTPAVSSKKIVLQRDGGGYCLVL